ncbi:3-keto-5-aminohexanoate cleavage protein [Agrobacterium tumefaciens]|uniref:3-keto-5-aminohexanoate cleavage protein n=1 Tax=Agrobacterium tumefaciens TaxID=358 RepID=A0A2L2LM78_AGRTU|nr:3-keto-5-aminohexanoate cleavage protein [Agrobacterium tumefaciens]AVH45406.1 3-keto-5-aminohexanoate cleavage protein [Agrobacterium tumefaciens]
MSSKLIITVAPTGGMAPKDASPHLPTQPAEIAESVTKSAKAGASIAALHARRPDHLATCNPDIYREINRLVREGSDIIINNSTGGGSTGDMVVERPDGIREINFEERMKGCEAGAEMCTLDAFTAVDTVVPGQELLVLTTPARCEFMAKTFQEKGIKPEWEVFSPAHILNDVLPLIEKGYDKPPYFINIVLGASRNFQGAMPYSHDVLEAMVKLLPAETVWNLSAIGPAQLPGTTQAMLWGGHVRVGLEDNLYFSRGVKATNEMLVERTVRIATELGLDIATPAEARKMLNLAPLN